MRVVDSEGRAAPFDEGVLILEENREYQIHLRGNEGVTSCHLGPVALARSVDGTAFVLHVGHTVGRMELVLDAPPTTLRQPVEVRPRAEKLDVAAWSALVDDLAAWLPDLLLGLSTASGGSVSLAGVQAGLAVAAMEPLLDPLLEAIAAVVRAPTTLDRERPVDRRMHAIRRVRPETLRWVARHPEVAATLTGSASGAQAPGDPWVPTRVPDATVDHPANRAVRWYAERVAAALDPLVPALRKASSGLMDDTAAWCLALAQSLERASARLRHLVASTFLVDLRAAPPDEGAMLTLQDEPRYARVMRLARRILGARFSADSPAGEALAPVRASFELYELWCLLAVRRSLDAAIGAAPWGHGTLGEDTLLAHDLGGLTLHRPHASGTLVIGYNHTFSAQAGRARHALTGERRPDLVVQWRAGDGEGAWVVLDAKYRVQRASITEAFASLHVYRDALLLRHHGGKPRAGLLLVPEVAEGCVAWAAEDFLAGHGLGLWRLRPGEAENGALGRWVLGRLGLA
ncbi:MAG: hypothetical protein JWM10_3517 [Myxococcaceae bacterium]|nr:hypothetical protein [Myxococcaceae bacterium]